MTVLTGLDRCVADEFERLQGLRVGAICNPTSVDRRLNHLADLLAQSSGVTLGALFGPEHGIRGTAQYMVEVEGVPTDPRTGVKVHSLYGSSFDSLTPTPEMLEGLDALIFDIQDVGSRYYTYVYTMALAMRAAGRAGLKFFVLDRPNPIDGVHVEGGGVRSAFRSFVGLYDLPTRHGMTAGELALLFNERHAPEERCELEVIACEGWDRSMEFRQTGLPWIPPSPNMPTVETARVYPGMCMLEGTNVSEGRGTTTPFEVWGAPFLDPYQLVEVLEEADLPGVIFRPCYFEPTFEKHVGEECGGVAIHVTSPQDFLPVRTGIACLLAARTVGGDEFQWRRDEYEFRDDVPAIDLLAGDDWLREGLEQGWTLSRLTSNWPDFLRAFLPVRARHLLY